MGSELLVIGIGLMGGTELRSYSGPLRILSFLILQPDLLFMQNRLLSTNTHSTLNQK